MDSETSDEGRSERLEAGGVIEDRYEIRRQLGEGGFAVVYDAFDDVIERQVAIKVLDIEHLAASRKHAKHILERFRREARLAAKVRHPSIVEIFDFGVLEDTNQPYMVMEFLRGIDLEEAIEDGGPMDPERLFSLFCGTLDALGEAHDEGVIHKDLKPANLFLSEPGTRKEALKLVDFGIAHVDAPKKERMTQTGMMAGTPQYLPPEYVEEQIVSPAMDIYQMGLILIEALAGEAAVQDSTPFQAAFKHVKRQLTIPPQLLEGEIGAVINRSIAYDPDDRFGSAEEFSDALAAVDPSSVPPIDAGGECADGQAVDVSSSPDTSAGTMEPLGAAGDGEDDELSTTPEGSSPEARKTGTVPQRRDDGQREASHPDETASMESTKSKAVPLVVLGVGLVAAVTVAILFWPTEGESDEETTGDEAVAEAPEVDEAQDDEASAEGAEDFDEAMEVAGSEEGDDEEDVRKVIVESDPPEAAVIREAGDEVGTTPVEIDIVGDEMKTLKVVADGYLEETVTIDDSTDDVLEVVLETEPDEPEVASPRPDPDPPPTGVGASSGSTGGGTAPTAAADEPEEIEDVEEPPVEEESVAEEDEDDGFPGMRIAE